MSDKNVKITRDDPSIEFGLNSSSQKVQEMYLSSSWRYNVQPNDYDSIIEDQDHAIGDHVDKDDQKVADNCNS